jgi:hypothetical protein
MITFSILSFMNLKNKRRKQEKKEWKKGKMTTQNYKAKQKERLPWASQV